MASLVRQEDICRNFVGTVRIKLDVLCSQRNIVTETRDRILALVDQHTLGSALMISGKSSHDLVDITNGYHKLEFKDGSQLECISDKNQIGKNLRSSSKKWWIVHLYQKGMVCP